MIHDLFDEEKLFAYFYPIRFFDQKMALALLKNVLYRLNSVFLSTRMPAFCILIDCLSMKNEAFELLCVCFCSNYRPKSALLENAQTIFCLDCVSGVAVLEGVQEALFASPSTHPAPAPVIARLYKSRWSARRPGRRRRCGWERDIRFESESSAWNSPRRRPHRWADRMRRYCRVRGAEAR